MATTVRKSSARRIAVSLAALLAGVSLAVAQPARITHRLDTSKTKVLIGNRALKARFLDDEGPLDPFDQISGMTLIFRHPLSRLPISRTSEGTARSIVAQLSGVVDAGTICRSVRAESRRPGTNAGVAGKRGFQYRRCRAQQDVDQVQWNQQPGWKGFPYRNPPLLCKRRTALRQLDRSFHSLCARFGGFINPGTGRFSHGTQRTGNEIQFVPRRPLLVPGDIGDDL